MDGNLHRFKLALDFSVGTSSDNFLNKFGQLKTDEERFSHALKKVIKHHTETLNSNREQKNSQSSIKSREDGNGSFRSNQYYKALKEYTKSIIQALDSSEELALAYANRSAALFKLEKYADCIDDIDRALNLKFPDGLKSKVYKRKGLCLTALGNTHSEASFREALVWLNKMNLSENEMNKSRIEIEKLISTPSTTAKPPKNETQLPLPKIVTPNAEIPCASDSVAIEYSKKFGRQIVATRDIKPGEILAIEEPYCIGLIPTHIYTHCSHCTKVSWALIPCEYCVNAAYCSEACKNEAWDEYHDVECPAIGMINNFKYDEPLLIGLRIVIKATNKGKNLDVIKQELNNVDCNKDCRTKGFSDDGKFHSDKYRGIYSLTDNVDKKSVDELISRSFGVALTVCILARESNMFGKKLALDELVNNPDVLFIGGLILKHLHISYTNMHSFGTPRTEHGNAAMVFCSLFNHSCDPNIFRQWYAGRMILFALYPIKQGEQVFESYGPYYHKRAKSEREELVRYWDFNCECRACIKNWPLYKDSPSYEEQPLTRKNKNKINNTLQKFYVLCANAMDMNTIEKSLTMYDHLLKSIGILFNLAQKPCREFQDSVDALREFYQSAEMAYQYESSNLSDMNEVHSVFYSSLQFRYSQK